MSRSKISRELKDAAIRRVRAGESRRAVAEELGLNLKTLGSWLRPGARPPAGAAVPSRDPFPPALVPVNDHRLADGDRPAPLSSFLRPELPAAALYGLPGRVATTLAEATGADPAMLLLDFLAMFGNAAGPQPHAWFGGAAHPARLFVLEAGDAATGKGTALAAVESLFEGADPDWLGSRMMVGLQSAEAMIDRVADDDSKDCRLMIVETEYQRLAETMNRAGTLSAQLRNAYDGRRLQRVLRDRSRSQQASHHHISVLAMITPEELLRHHARLRQPAAWKAGSCIASPAPSG